MNGHLNKILTIESRESGFAERDRNQAFVLRYYLSFVAKINRFEASTKAKSVCVHLRPRSFCVLKRTYIIPHVLFKTFQYLQILIRINRTYGIRSLVFLLKFWSYLLYFVFSIYNQIIEKNDIECACIFPFNCNFYIHLQH